MTYAPETTAPAARHHRAEAAYEKLAQAFPARVCPDRRRRAGPRAGPGPAVRAGPLAERGRLRAAAGARRNTAATASALSRSSGCSSNSPRRIPPWRTSTARTSPSWKPSAWNPRPSRTAGIPKVVAGEIFGNAATEGPETSSAPRDQADARRRGLAAERQEVLHHRHHLRRVDRRNWPAPRAWRAASTPWSAPPSPAWKSSTTGTASASS